MTNFNMAVVEGRLTKDCELIYSSRGFPILKFCIANNWYKRVSGKKEQRVSFFNIVAMNKLAEIMSKYLKKGTRIIVSGRLNIENYKNTKGENKTWIEIIANNIDFFNSEKKEKSIEE